MSERNLVQFVVEDDAMSPRIEAGEMVTADLSAAPVIGGDVLITLRNGEGGLTQYVRRLAESCAATVQLTGCLGEGQHCVSRAQIVAIAPVCWRGSGWREAV